MSLLALDVGNTNISVGLFREEDLEKVLKIPTSIKGEVFWPEVERKLQLRLSKVKTVAISSVVKEKEGELKEALERYLAHCGLRSNLQVVVLDRKTPWPMVSTYKGNLGTDRILAAIAGVRLYGKPLVVIDIGSAVTIDLIDREGVFRGGIILPGAGMRTRALAEFTSALPLIPIPEGPPPLIGADTVECISSGIYHGMRQEIQGLVATIQKELKMAPTVVVTGRGNRLFKSELPSGWRLDDWLVIKGIRFTLSMLKL